LLASEAPGLIAEQRRADPAGWEWKTVETNIKYEGYLTQQRRQMDQLRAAEGKSIPPGFDYSSLPGLSREMRENSVASVPSLSARLPAFPVLPRRAVAAADHA